MNYGVADDNFEPVKETKDINYIGVSGVCASAMEKFGLNRNFGTVDDIPYIGMSREEPKYMQILRKFRPTISFDISINSTGITVWTGSELKFFVIDVSEYNNNDYDVKDEFAKLVSEIVNEYQENEIICVEDVFGGVSFSVTKELIRLNDVPKELNDKGILVGRKLVKKDNKVWKSDFRKLSPKISGALNDKEEIKRILQYLGFPVESLDRFNINGKNDRSQDLMDSLGLMLTVAVDYANGGKTVKRKVKMSDYEVSWYDSIETYEAFGGGENGYTVVTGKGDIERAFLSAGASNEGVLVMKTSSSALGVFGTKYGIPYDQDELCIVLEPTKRRRTKKTNIIS